MVNPSEMEEATVIVGGQLLTLAQSMAMRVGMTTFLHLMEQPKALGDNEVGEELRSKYVTAATEIVRIISQSRRRGG